MCAASRWARLPLPKAAANVEVDAQSFSDCEAPCVGRDLGSPYTGFNVLAAEPWRGVWRLEERMPDDVLTEVRAALLASPGEGELRGATASALTCYLMLRRRLAEQCGMPLNEELAAEVLAALRSPCLQPIPPRAHGCASAGTSL